MYPLIGNWELAGQLLSLFFGVIILFPLYGVFRRVFGVKVALLAAFLATISPYLVHYSVHVRSESLYLFLSTATIFLFVSAMQEQRIMRFLGGGMVAGYAYLVRPEAIGFLAVFPLKLGIRTIIWKDYGFAAAAKSVAALYLGFLFFALPFIVYLSIDTGRLGALSRKAGITLAIDLSESGLLEPDDIPNGGHLGSLVFTEFVRRHPVLYVKKVILDLIPALGEYLEALYYSYVPFLAIGLFLLFRDRHEKNQEVLLFSFVVFYVLAFAFIYVKRRYALQAVPISLAWVAAGMLCLWDWLKARYTVRQSRVIALCLALMFIGGTLPKTLKAISKEKAYVRDAGRFLKTTKRNGNLKIAVIDERITFYADAEAISLLGVKPAELPAKFHKEMPDYLAVEAKAFHNLFPDLASEPERYGLKLEKVFTGTRKDRLLIYKFV